jgi:hypothetical protein
VIFTPLRQGNPGGSNLQICTRLGPQAMANVLVREVKAIDANLAPGEVITMREQGTEEPGANAAPSPGSGSSEVLCCFYSASDCTA